jgi:two-component system capsular synthesis response regulator RcsB
MVEKRLKQIRDELDFSKNEQLVLFCKEMGIL